jgi:hypothetical protein
MSSLIGPVFWLALAVALTGVLHMVVVMVDLWPALKRPLDGGKSLGGKRIFGDNKTWRGVVFMVVGSAGLGFVQGAFGGVWAASSGVELIDFGAIGGGDGWLAYAVGYAEVNAVFGLGYALGELPNSFLKRRIDITPGKTGSGLLGGFFFLLDQADSVLAALALGTVVFGIGWDAVLVGTVCLTGLHLFINGALYLTKVRKNL